MVHTHRKSIAAAKRLLVAALLPIGAAVAALPAAAQDSSTDNSYSAPASPPPAASKKRASRDDAYSPPPEQRSYLQPLDAPSSGTGGGDDMWSQPARGAGSSGSDRGNRSDPQNAVMRDAIPPAVDKGDLAPVMSSDGSGLPLELWGGLNVGSLEKLISHDRNSAAVAGSPRSLEEAHHVAVRRRIECRFRSAAA